VKKKKKKAREGNSNRKKKTGKEVTKTSSFFFPSLFLSLAPPFELVRVMMRNSQPSCIFFFEKKVCSSWEQGWEARKILESCKNENTVEWSRDPPSLVTPIALYESSAKEKTVAKFTWSNVCNHNGTKQILLRTSNVWQQQKAWQEEFS